MKFLTSLRKKKKKLKRDMYEQMVNRRWGGGGGGGEKGQDGVARGINTFIKQLKPNLITKTENILFQVKP